MALQAIRGRTGSIFIKLLFALLIFSFAIWGIGDIFRGSSDAPVAVSIGDEITLRNEDIGALLQSPNPYPFLGQNTEYFGFLRGYIAPYLLTLAARDQGLVISNDVLRDVIRNQEIFADEDGEFSRAQLEMFLFSNQLSEPQLRQQYSRELLQALQTLPLSLPSALPAPYLSMLYKYYGESRLVQRISLSEAFVDRLIEGVAENAISQEDIARYYEDNEADFLFPESRDATILVLDPQEIAQSIEIPRSELEELVEQDQVFYHVGEQRAFRQVFFSDENQAHRFFEIAQEVEDLEAAREEFLSTAENGSQALRISELSLGFARDLPFEPLAVAGFALAPDEISQPIQTSIGWHILAVSEIVSAEDQRSEQTIAEIRNHAQLDRAYDIVFDLAGNIESELAQGRSFEEIAQSYNIDLRVITGSNAAGMQMGGQEVLSEDPRRLTYLQVVFEELQQEGTISGLYETADEVFYQIRLDSIDPPQQVPLEMVSPQIEERLLAQLTQERLQEAITNLRNQAQEAENWETLLTNPDIVREERNMGRFDSDFMSLPWRPEDRSAAFALSEVGESEIITNGQEVYILRLLGIITPDLESFQDDPLYQQQMESEWQLEIFRAYMDYLWDHYNVEINQDVLLDGILETQGIGE